jgi:hypothetical protein
MGAQPVKRLARVLLLLGFVCGCSDTVGERVTLGASARGAESPSFDAGDFRVTLELAEVGFGPLYLCASNVPSDELCGTALAELAASVTVDALDGSSQPLPALEGTTGTVHSAVFDYGISWTLTGNTPRATAGAPQGHSLRVRGTATRENVGFEFFSNVDVVVKAAGRMASGLTTEHTLKDDRSHLELGFDPRAWLADVDFDGLAEEARATPDEAVEIAPGTSSYDSIVMNMTSREQVDFAWSRH